MATLPTVLRPTGTDSSTGWLVTGGSGATAAGVTADDSDASYINDNTSSNTTQTAPDGHQLYFTFAKPTIPANAALAKVVPRVRWKRTTTQDNKLITAASAPYGSRYPNYSTPSNTNQTTYNAFTTVTLAAGPAVLPGDTPSVDTCLTQLGLLIATTGTSGNAGQAQVAEVYLDVYFNEQPVPSAVTASSLSASSAPTFKWTYTDPENDPQAAFRAAIWLAADAADANFPRFGRTFIAADGTTRTALASTGDATDSVQSANSAWDPKTSLPNGNLVICVQVADQIGDRLRWSTAIAQQSFTMNVSPPAAPTITLTGWSDAPTYANVGTVSAAAYSHTPATTQTIYVERQVGDATGPWDLLPAPAGVALPGGTAQTVSWVDQLVRSGSPVRYRAYVVHSDGTNTYQTVRSAATAWSTRTFTQFMLRNPLDTSNPVLLVQFTASFKYSSDEQMAVTYGGATASGAPVPPSFTSNAIQHSSFPVSIMLKNETDLQTLWRLRQAQTVLLLQTDMTGLAHWVRFGPNLSWEQLFSTLRRTAARRPYAVEGTMYVCAPAQRADGSFIGAY